MYVLEGNRIISRLNSGQPGVEVAVLSGTQEAGMLLVARANLADRDEQLLDQLGQTITTRNDA